MRVRRYFLPISITFCLIVFALPSLGAPVSATSLVKPEVPAGTIIPLVLKNLISSRSAFVGEAVYCETIFPVVVDNRVEIPAGSYVKGEVTDVVRPGKIKGKASISLRFTSITFQNGMTLPLSAGVYSIAGSRLEEGKSEAQNDQQESAQGSGQDMAVGGAQDAVIDATGLGSGSPITAATQGVGGLIVMLATRGKTIVMRPGTNLELRLTNPLTTNAGRSSMKTGKKKSSAASSTK